MSTFPYLSNIDGNVVARMKSLAGSNVNASKLIPWIRVTSGANLVLESIYGNNSFSSVYGNSQRSGRVGTTWDGKDVFESSTISARGYRPSPVIESLSVENGHKGLTRKCKFSIKCFSLPQAEKITQYFLEPGYTCLIEYGWNLPESISQKVKLSACSIASMNNFDKTETKRFNSNGTYDVFLGYQTGGGMKSGDSETYVVDVELTTIGEIPAYLQPHKTGTDNNEKSSADSSKPYSIQEIEDAADDQDSIGKALFMQMFNRLPGNKQTSRVKKLIDGKDSNGIPWASEDNFINMDDEIREKLIEDLQDTSVRSSESEVEIPEGAPLVSDQAFIRVELAFEILNSYVTGLEPKDTPCSGVKSYRYFIDIKNCVCKTFNRMFSTDESILYIPNPKLPDFGLINALSSTEELDTFIDLNRPPINGAQGVFQFPRQEQGPPQTLTNGRINQQSAAGNWGYLKDLYINMDFFVDVISRSNYVAKDVYYELLNGLSSAANSYWHFEIVENRSDDPLNAGDLQLSVVDLNFTGNVSVSSTTPKFRAVGTDTPFLSSELTFDIPGAMKNSILGKRSSSKNQNNGKQEGQDIKVGTIFNGQPDAVLAILNSFKEDGDEDEPQDQGKSNGDKDEDEIRKANYELFMRKAGVFPKLKKRDDKLDAAVNFWTKVGFNLTGNDGNLEDIVFIGTWDDTALLNQYRGIDESDAENNILLPIQFSFTVHGVSGLRVGDIFQVIDLPSQYTKSAFQIIEVSHDIDQSSWKTNVRAQLRNM